MISWVGYSGKIAFLIMSAHNLIVIIHQYSYTKRSTKRKLTTGHIYRKLNWSYLSLILFKSI